MIHTHSLGVAARYYPDQIAVAAEGRRSIFHEFHDPVGRFAAGLSKHGFEAGDRFAIFLPNEPDYLEWIYSCAWSGVIVVPLNRRLSVAEIDRILAEAGTRGLIRHSSLPVPTAQPSLQLVADQNPLNLPADSHPGTIYDPDPLLALMYTSGTTSEPRSLEYPIPSGANSSWPSFV